ncbi:NTP transferase domain-containing protein [bacterium]|nr:NTP transferase domain-containing protein [bacterium]
MGSNKLALPWRETTLLSHLVHQAIEHVDRMIVLLGPISHELASQLPARAEVLLIERQTEQMRETIEQSLSLLAGEADDVGILLLLADQPHLSSVVMDTVIAAYRRHPSRIIIPTFQGRRGHPIVLPMFVLRGLRGLAADRGLNALIRLHESQQTLVAINDAGIIEDIDEPADYERHRPP